MQPMASPVGTASYAAAAVAFLVLFVLLVTSWRGRLPGILLAVASLATAVWAGVAAYLAGFLDVAWRPVGALEVVRNAAWFAFLLVLLGYSQKAVRPLRLVTVGLAIFCGVVLAATLYEGSPATLVGTFGVLGRLALALIGMILVEQLFRNINLQQRWGIKFLCLGLGGLFAYDFYLYSDALLFRQVNEDIWAARGVVDALTMPLLAVAAARNPTWSLDVSVSRRFVFHSTAVVGAAVYLLVMAGAGYYIRYFGGSWGVILQVAFLFGAVLLLVVILVSGTLRARLRVFLAKNFFSYHYDYREEWLRFTRTLSAGEPGLRLRERSIQAIAELVDSPGGALWLSHEPGRYEPAAHWNMPAQGIEPAESGFCELLEKRQWVITVEELAGQPQLYDGLAIPAWLRALPDAWLVVPLMLHEQLLGFVVLSRSKARIRLNWEVTDILKTAGRQAASYLAQLEAAQALLVARQFETFSRMSAFVVHDLKNLVAQLSLLLANADRHKSNPAFQEDMLETVANSVEKMNRLLAQLRGVYTLEPAVPVALPALLQGIVSARSGLKPVPTLEVSESTISVVGHPARLERTIGHLVQNAIEATPPDGRVVVKLLKENGSAAIAIADTGCGMSEQFLQSRLFRPFQSTKAMGMGIGTYEAREYVRELGGRIEVESRETRGTIFRVILPLYTPDQMSDARPAAESHA